MKLPSSSFTSRSWRIHQLTSDFRLEDVWQLPVRGDADDLKRLVGQLAASDPARDWPAAARALWRLRWQIGRLTRWDRSEAGVGTRVPSLRDRMAADLHDGPSGPAFDRFTPLYLRDDEFAAEIANQTVHAVMHIGWVKDPAGGYHGEMAVLVKANGLLGEAYMAAIKPFRHLIIYPAMLRQIQAAWNAGASDPLATGA